MDGGTIEVSQTISQLTGGTNEKAGPSASSALDSDQPSHHAPAQDALQADPTGNSEHIQGLTNLTSLSQAAQGQWNSQTAVLVHSDLRSTEGNSVSIATIVPQEHSVQHGHLVLAQYVMPVSQNQAEEMVSRDAAYLSLGGSYSANQSQWTGQLIADTGIKNPIPDSALISASALMLQDQSASGQGAQKLIKIDAQSAKLLATASQGSGKVRVVNQHIFYQQV